MYIHEQMDRSHKLSPEAYLRYPVELTPGEYPPYALADGPRISPFKFRPMNIAPIRTESFLDALRSARLQTLDYPDMEYLKTS